MNSQHRDRINALIVDNSTEKLRGWTAKFRSVAGFEPLTALTFREAELILHAQSIDILVVDLCLSEESEASDNLAHAEGLQLIELCRERNKKSRIIAITSIIGETPEAGAESLLRGADDFISNQWQGLMAGPLLKKKLEIFLLALEKEKERETNAE